MNADVHGLLSAASGAIPTLLLALVFQKPLLMGMARVARFYRAGVDAFERNLLGRIVILLAPTLYIGRHLDYLIIVVGTLGMITSVALQAVPTALWTDDPTWGSFVPLVVWFHIGVVVFLASTVGAGLLVIAKGARTPRGQDDSEAPTRSES